MRGHPILYDARIPRFDKYHSSRGSNFMLGVCVCVTDAVVYK